MKTAHKVIYDQGVSVFYRLENTSSVFWTYGFLGKNTVSPEINFRAVS